MKKNLLSLFLLIFTVNSQAQYYKLSSSYENIERYQVIDSAYVKCSYKTIFRVDSLLKDRYEEDIQILEIGRTITKYYSQFALDYIESIKPYIEKNEPYPSKPNFGWNQTIIKNYPQGKETVTDIGSMLGGNYKYEEELPIFEWKVQNENDTILSYPCIKATTSFRGRDYIAWFTPDIPIPSGPWKFGGLPGLILKLEDSKKNFIFECNGIMSLTANESIKYYLLSYNKVSRIELNKLYKRFHNNYINYKNAQGTKVVVVDPITKMKTTNPQSFRFPYNPIELE